MTALVTDKPFVTAGNSTLVDARGYPAKSGAVLYQGATLARDPADSSLVKPAAAAKPYYQVIGVNSSRLTGDGIVLTHGTAGCYERNNSTSTDAVLATLPLGWPLYAVDDQTVALTDGDGTRAFLGVFGGMSMNGKPLVWIGMDPIGLQFIKWPVVFAFGDLSAAALTQTLNFGPVTPGPTRLIGYSCDSLAVFSGGSIATATFKLGLSTDDDAIHTALDIFTGAASAPKHGTPGVLGYTDAPFAAGVQFMGTFTTTTANVNAATAGAFVGSIHLRPGS
jgi:hypothetical protein